MTSFVVSAATPDPVESSSLSRLPDDVVRHIFWTYLRSCDARELPYWRRHAYMCSSEWLHFLRRHPEFWSQFFVDFRDRSVALRVALDLSGTRPIHLRIEFTHLSLYQAACKRLCSISTLVRARLLPFRDVVHRIASFSIIADNSDVFLASRTFFRLRPAPSLRILSLDFQYHLSAADMGDKLKVTESYWFTRDLPSLTALDLARTSLPLYGMSLPSLTRLRLANSVDNAFMGFTEFRALFAGCPNLQDVVLVGIPCWGALEGDPIGDGVIESLSVTRLRVRFDKEGSLGLLFASFLFPNLRGLSLRISRPSDLVHVLSAQPSTLTSVTHLYLVCAQRLDVSPVFARFPSVHVLDLSLCPRAFSRLVDSSSISSVDGLTSVLPSLVTLYIPYEPPRLVRDFAVLHGANDDDAGLYLPLQRIFAQAPFPRSYVFTRDEQLDLAWLSDHLHTFRLSIHPIVTDTLVPDEDRSIYFLT
ncbi:hypothetical protein B0H11DRAFT_2236187 [Mycena galericulata]|nr:hypothetical protein B0H11DRAFT_2236187 [Mycena galericulata]